MPRTLKWFSTLSMAVAVLSTWFVPAPSWLRFASLAVAVMVAAWLWQRPDA